MKRAIEKLFIKQVNMEVKLAQRLIKILNASDASWFLEAHPEHSWDECNAMEAWEAWISSFLSVEEMSVYMERYQFNFDSMSELKNGLLVECNRIPSPGNIDGY